MDFRVGDEVVCVDDSKATSPVYGLGATYWNPPVRGATYTIAGLGVAWDGASPVVYLAEQANPHRDTGEEQGYWAARFRKVERRNDRLSIEAFSVIKDGGFEEPRRKAPAKKRERVQ